SCDALALVHPVPVRLQVGPMVLNELLLVRVLDLALDALHVVLLLALVVGPRDLQLELPQLRLDLWVQLRDGPLLRLRLGVLRHRQRLRVIVPAVSLRLPLIDQVLPGVQVFQVRVAGVGHAVRPRLHRFDQPGVVLDPVVELVPLFVQGLEPRVLVPGAVHRVERLVLAPSDLDRIPRLSGLLYLFPVAPQRLVVLQLRGSGEALAVIVVGARRLPRSNLDLVVVDRGHSVSVLFGERLRIFVAKPPHLLERVHIALRLLDIGPERLWLVLEPGLFHAGDDVVLHLVVALPLLLGELVLVVPTIVPAEELRQRTPVLRLLDRTAAVATAAACQGEAGGTGTGDEPVPPPCTCHETRPYAVYMGPSIACPYRTRH